MPEDAAGTRLTLVGQGTPVPCIDGASRPYVDLDAAASTPALTAVAESVAEFLPLYSSIHRGAGWKSRTATAAYESARGSALEFCGMPRPNHVAVLCRNTTEAINHLAYRLRFSPDDVVLTTVIEHHANLLPWGRVATRRYVECERDGTFGIEALEEGLKAHPRPSLLAITGASNVSGWLPPIAEMIELAHLHGVPVMLDAAQLAPHRPIPASADFVAFSGHKLYAPFGTGVLVAPRDTFADGDPFLAGGGAVDLVDLEDVVWTEPPEREEAGSPNVVGAVALHSAISELTRLGWDAIEAHGTRLARKLREGLAAIDGVEVLGPRSRPDQADPPALLPMATFNVAGTHHALVASRLSAEWGIGVRHGCFCAHPYLVRLLGMGPEEVAAYRDQVSRGDHRYMPGAVRASCSLATSDEEVDALLAAVAAIAADSLSGRGTPVPYVQDMSTGDFWPDTDSVGWSPAERDVGSSCARG